MTVPKKRTSISKKRIRKNIWERKGYGATLKALSLGKYREFKKFFCTTNK